jgi:hypothetical protein
LEVQILLRAGTLHKFFSDCHCFWFLTHESVSLITVEELNIFSTSKSGDILLRDVGSFALSE